MSSFDIVSEVDLQEVRNAVTQTSREISTRFDFKGSNASVEFTAADIELTAQNEFQLKQLQDILIQKLSKRGINVASLTLNKPQLTLAVARQIIILKQGIDTELAKRIVKIFKDSKLKVQAAIQGDQVRVSGKQRDELQAAMTLLSQQNIALPLQFTNFRD